MPRSTYYHRPRPESVENLRLLRRLDELYMDCPFFGSRRMAVTLEVNRKRIQRLMRILGIEALCPKPNLSRPAAGHEIYPYLLRGVSIERPNQLSDGQILSNLWGPPQPTSTESQPKGSETELNPNILHDHDIASLRIIGKRAKCGHWPHSN